jgi:hypothetical protein
VSLPFAVLMTAFTLFMMTIGSTDAYAQPEKIQLEHWGNGGAVKTIPAWRNGNLNPNNSHYWEGDADAVRMIFDNLSPGSTYTVTFSWLAAKKQGNGNTAVKHAHDFLTDYTFSEYPSYKLADPPPAVIPNLPDSEYPDPCDPRVQGGGKGPGVCELGSIPTDVAEIPLDTLGNGVSAVQIAAGRPQYFAIWNAIIDSVGPYDYYTKPDSNNAENFTKSTYITMSITFTVRPAGGGAGLLGEDEGVVLAFGGHLAKGSGTGGWGSGRGAADIHGAPYHWSYELVQVGNPPETIAKGSRDRSIMLRRNGHIQVVKECENELPTDGDFQFAATNAPNVLPEDGLPNTFTLDCDEADTIEQSAGINGGSGSYSIQETIQAGFLVTDIVCEIRRPNGDVLGEKLLTITVNDGTPKAYPGDLPAAGPGTVKATFEFNAGEIVICTFTNVRPTAKITLTPNEDRNLLNQPHEITATVTYNVGGSDIPAANTVVEFSLIDVLGSGADFNPPGDDECTTNASGVCVIDIVSALATVVDIHATADVDVEGLTVTVSTGTHVTGDDTTDARKTYEPPSPGLLTIIKCVINDDGGDADPTAFKIFLNGVELVWADQTLLDPAPTCANGTAKGFVVSIELQSNASGVIPFPYAVTEQLIAGYAQLSASADCNSTFTQEGQEKTCTIVNDDRLDGRMTGGGSVFYSRSNPALIEGKNERNVRITHGFELHCNPTIVPNRLEVVWHDGANAFHLELLESAYCKQVSSPPDQENPEADFDTYYGTGLGRINKQPGKVYRIVFKLTDHGEPANQGGDTGPDTSQFDVYEVLANGSNGAKYLSSYGEKPLEQGNHQAHEENKN